MPKVAERNLDAIAPVAATVETPLAFRSYRFAQLIEMARRRRWLMLAIVGGLVLLCLLYCLIASNQYEATSLIALRIQASSSLSLEGAESIAPASILSTPLQLETMVNVLRSERLAWRVISDLKLYNSPAFSKSFSKSFPNFQAAKPDPQQQGYLLDAFAKRLRVRTLPRTLLIEIRFRSKDPVLAAAVANALVRDYSEVESETRNETTRQGSAWLKGQLITLNSQADGDARELAEFERQHKFLSTEQSTPDGQPVETLHDSTVLQVDELGRQLAAATGDRILREAQLRQAQQGDPDRVLETGVDGASTEMAGGSLLRQLRAQHDAIETEQAQLAAEHGPSFPRVVELRRALAAVDAQSRLEESKLLESFQAAQKAAADRERILRAQLDALMTDGMRQNDASMQYAVLHGRVTGARDLASRLERRIQEAALSAGVHASSILVVDVARVPYKPVAPNLPLYLGITLLAAVWIALGLGLALDALGVKRLRIGRFGLLFVLATTMSARLPAQAPTPNTQGLPSGVVRIPEPAPVNRSPDPRASPPVWNTASPNGNAGLETPGRPPGAAIALPVELPIEAGDFLDISEYHTPEFRSSARVAPDGTVTLPMIGAVQVSGLNEQAAARAIERALLDDGMLLHPQVSVLITGAVGQDVSVLGEVARPGVYPYTAHHRLLDLISAASGLSANAGRLVSVFHREDPHTGHPFVLEPVAAALETGRERAPSRDDHNPELEPGDTIVVSRAGLAYVIGDVVRPGGFAVDPVQGLTVVEALSLAWGSTPNAAVGKAILIRNQAGGRTLTTINIRRMIHGQDPDLPVRDRDILFIPDSQVKALMNKTLESAIQSAIGVSIYAGLVYSQRF